MSFFGAIIGGILTLLAVVKIGRQNVSYWVNVVVRVLPLGQAIGRIANGVNQELYGTPTKLPWAIYISPEKRSPEYYYNETFHPLFAYEALLNIILFFIVNKYKSSAIYIYLCGYGLIRFFLEFLRIQKDTWYLGQFNVAQVICIIMILIGLGGIFAKHRRTKTRNVLY
jgi:phosphatidylglycerol:prolipoprotein diacylglycerol transferase